MLKPRAHLFNLLEASERIVCTQNSTGLLVPDLWWRCGDAGALQSVGHDDVTARA